MGKFDSGDMKLHFNTGCRADNKLWLISSEYNLLAYYDYMKGTFEYAASFPDYRFNKGALFSNVSYFAGKLFITPFAADYIAIYDITKGKMQTIDIPKPEQDGLLKYCSEPKFGCSVLCDNTLYMIARYYPAIISINLETYELKQYNGWLKFLNRKIKGETGYFWKNVFVKNGVLYMASYNAGCVLSFDTKTESFQCLYENANAAYMSCTACGEMILLSDWINKKVEVIDFKGNHLSDILIDCIGYESDDQAFGVAVSGKDHVLIFPKCANAVLNVNLETMRADIVGTRHYDYKQAKNCRALDLICQDSNLIWCLRSDINVFDIYSAEGTFMKSVQSTVSQELLTWIKEKYMSEILSEVCIEGKDLSLKEFIREIRVK